MRIYRLTNEPGGLGLSCTAAGLSLAGTPLLRSTEAGFAPRPGAEIASLMKAAYGADGDATFDWGRASRQSPATSTLASSRAPRLPQS